MIFLTLQSKDFTIHSNLFWVENFKCSEAQPNKGAVGKEFKKEAKQVMDALAALEKDAVEELAKQLAETK